MTIIEAERRIAKMEQTEHSAETKDALEEEEKQTEVWKVQIWNCVQEKVIIFNRSWSVSFLTYMDGWLQLMRWSVASAVYVTSRFVVMIIDMQKHRSALWILFFKINNFIFFMHLTRKSWNHCFFTWQWTSAMSKMRKSKITTLYNTLIKFSGKLHL